MNSEQLFAALEVVQCPTEADSHWQVGAMSLAYPSLRAHSTCFVGALLI